MRLPPIGCRSCQLPTRAPNYNYDYTFTTETGNPTPTRPELQLHLHHGNPTPRVLLYLAISFPAQNHILNHLATSQSTPNTPSLPLGVSNRNPPNLSGRTPFFGRTPLSTPIPVSHLHLHPVFVYRPSLFSAPPHTRQEHQLHSNFQIPFSPSRTSHLSRTTFYHNFHILLVSYWLFVKSISEETPAKLLELSRLVGVRAQLRDPLSPHSGPARHAPTGTGYSTRVGPKGRNSPRILSYEYLTPGNNHPRTPPPPHHEESRIHTGTVPRRH